MRSISKERTKSGRLVFGADGICWRLRPGVFDDDAQEACLWGQCHALALALHESSGWPLVAVYEDDDIIHVAVKIPDGRLLDAGGYHNAYEIAEYYDRTLDDISEVTQAEVEALADSNDWRRPETELASTWIPCLLEREQLN